MRQSRIIRISCLILLMGVGFWGMLILPRMYARDDARVPGSAGAVYPVNRTSTVVAIQDSPSPGGGGGIPGGASAGGAGGPMGPPIDFAVPGIGTSPDLEASAPGSGGAPSAGGPMGGPPGMMGSAAGMGRGMMGAGMGMGGGMGMPVLSQAQMEELNLARQAKGLLIAYSREQAPEQKEKLKSQLRAVLHRQFRLQHQRRDGELARIEHRLADLRSKLKKRSDAQSTIVDRRLEQLVNDVDGLGWSVEEVPDNLFNEVGTGAMPSMPGMPPGAGEATFTDPNEMPNPMGLEGPPELPVEVKAPGESAPVLPGLPGAPPPATEIVPPTPTTPTNPAGTLDVPGNAASSPSTLPGAPSTSTP